MASQGHQGGPWGRDDGSLSPVNFDDPAMLNVSHLLDSIGGGDCMFLDGLSASMSGPATTSAHSSGIPNQFGWPATSSASCVTGAGAGAGAGADAGGGSRQAQPLEVTSTLAEMVHGLASEIEGLKRENTMLHASVLRNQSELVSAGFDVSAGYGTAAATPPPPIISTTLKAKGKEKASATKDRGKGKEKEKSPKEKEKGGKGKGKLVKEKERVRDMRDFNDIKDKKNKPKKPFCNACRRLVMDRVNVFLVFHPHPGTNASTNKLFETTVRNQYQKDRYKSRKMSVEYCMCCRTPELEPRLAIDRFDALWHTDAIQLRLATQWYKEVRRIDIELGKQSEKLQACAGLAAGHAQVKEIIKTMRGLEAARSSLKPIQKASARITEKTDGPQFYAEGIKKVLVACAEATRTAPIPASILKRLQTAVVNYPLVLCPQLDGASKELLAISPFAVPCDMPADWKAALKCRNGNSKTTSKASAAKRGGGGSKKAAAGPAVGANVGEGTIKIEPVDATMSTGGGGGGAAGAAGAAGGGGGGGGGAAADSPGEALLIPTQFNLRFTHVGSEIASLAAPSHQSMVEVGVEAGFADMVQASGAPELYIEDGLQIVKMEPGSIVVVVVQHLVQPIPTTDSAGAEKVAPDTAVARLQAALRAMPQELLQAVYPNLTLDPTATCVQQLTSAELAALVEVPDAGGLSFVSAQNATLRGELLTLLKPLMVQRTRWLAANRKLQLKGGELPWEPLYDNASYNSLIAAAVAGGGVGAAEWYVDEEEPSEEDGYFCDAEEASLWVFQSLPPNPSSSPPSPPSSPSSGEDSDEVSDGSDSDGEEVQKIVASGEVEEDMKGTTALLSDTAALLEKHGVPGGSSGMAMMVENQYITDAERAALAAAEDESLAL